MSPTQAVAIASLADYEPLARERLDAATWAYFNGGAGDEITVRANAADWAALRLLPRVLQPLDGAHTRVELLGRMLAHPLLVAPMAWQRLLHPDAETGMAVAASAQEAGYVLSTQTSTPPETVARAVAGDASRGPLWFQLYVQADAGFNRELMQRAEQAGFEAFVVTVDAPVHGARDAERRSGFRLPPGLAALALPAAGAAPAGTPGILRHLRGTPTWAGIEELIARARVPVLLKGILHPQDALQAVRVGAAGLIVSNHGGRTLDTAASTAFALPRIADAVQGERPLLVDGGIRRGTDVLKALALGARAVLVGRPAAWGLAVAGPPGAAHVLRLLRDEFEIALALTGCANPAHVNRDLIV